ncbi:hypothetical protein LCGC14_3109250 [marine sediment metagenome]|uniref:Uncharacterized protein n=1 Tax=marine sediment metagenome TaxID=412755 RepID=A0A0F8WUC8_9ZZZZ
MTEKEAWLEIARTYDGDGPCQVGLCWSIRDIPSCAWRAAMRKRLRLFAPSRTAVWYWPINKSREARDLRATACCFLAAMCDTVTPKRRVKGS